MINQNTICAICNVNFFSQFLTLGEDLGGNSILEAACGTAVHYNCCGNCAACAGAGNCPTCAQGCPTCAGHGWAACPCGLLHLHAATNATAQAYGDYNDASTGYFLNK
ncbi:MAG TPA: hypothetical protein VH333_00855 [Pseudonocardiaceae bacterium]|nr:hypothetical protein [Pseudonocardiaceae bacterium]